MQFSYFFGMLQLTNCVENNLTDISLYTVILIRNFLNTLVSHVWCVPVWLFDIWICSQGLEEDPICSYLLIMIKSLLKHFNLVLHNGSYFNFMELCNAGLASLLSQFLSRKKKIWSNYSNTFEENLARIESVSPLCLKSSFFKY